MAEQCVTMKMVEPGTVYRSREGNFSTPDRVVAEEKVCWNGFMDMVTKWMDFSTTHSCPGCKLLTEKWPAPAVEEKKSAEKWPTPSKAPAGWPVVPELKVGPGRCY